MQMSRLDAAVQHLAVANRILRTAGVGLGRSARSFGPQSVSSRL
jgi:hypothetical protein